MADYCTPADVYAYGAPAGAVAEEARLVREGGVVASDDTITLDGHGFSLDAPLQFRFEGTGGSLPAPLVQRVTYYAIPVDRFRFKVAAAPAGAAIDLTSAGSGVLVISMADPVLAACTWASRMVDSFLSPHVLPLVEPVPEIVRFTAAQLAAGQWAARAGAQSAALAEIVKNARELLSKWSAGQPIRGATPAQPRANLATAAAAPSDASGWKRFGGI